MPAVDEPIKAIKQTVKQHLPTLSKSDAKIIQLPVVVITEHT